MTSSNGNIFRVTGPLCGEFTGPGEFPAQRPVTRSFDVFLDLHPNKRLSKQWRGWWFETQLCPLWRHRNVLGAVVYRLSGSESDVKPNQSIYNQLLLFKFDRNFVFLLSRIAMVNIFYMTSRQFCCSIWSQQTHHAIMTSLLRQDNVILP